MIQLIPTSQDHLPLTGSGVESVELVSDIDVAHMKTVLQPSWENQSVHLMCP